MRQGGIEKGWHLRKAGAVDHGEKKEEEENDNGKGKRMKMMIRGKPKK